MTFTKDKIIGIVDCDQYKDNFVDLYLALQKLYKPAFQTNEKILVKSRLDYFTYSHGLILQSLQVIVNNIDISNCFICFETTNKNIHQEYQYVHKTFSIDPTKFEIKYVEGDFARLPATNIKPYTKIKNLNSKNEIIRCLTDEQKKLLFTSKNFCILPWISMFISIENKVTPCCQYDDKPIGESSKNNLKEIWNNKNFQNIRKKMLNDESVHGCSACIHLEKIGKESLRTSMNIDFSQYVHIAENNTTPQYNLKYIDSRFNNLCNLSCRMCGHSSSSSWHAPSVAIGKINKNVPVFLKAGRTNTDLYEQIIEQVDNLDRINFAGGEPLMIEDNYNLLLELDKRQHHDIALIYNTNMTNYKLKGRNIFDLWKNFKNITIGGSLDAEGERASYLRTGTNWDNVLDFRRKMLTLRPDIDFFISATPTIINTLHLPDFHRSWVDQELIRPEQFSIQTLHDPQYLRVKTAPAYLRNKIIKKYKSHLRWLRPLDREGRATQSFESILDQLKDPVPFDAKDFWKNIDPLDKFYNANLIESFPELVDLPR